MPKYVVTAGRRTGIFESWAECKAQVDHFPRAKYHKLKPGIKCVDALCVDAACSRPPGPTEYRGVIAAPDGSLREVFHVKYTRATNNIGEFLALVHGLCYAAENCPDITIYSDSKTAISWAKRCVCNTTCTEMDETARKDIELAVSELLPRHEKLLRNVKKWDTSHLGEIPADFGRK